MDREKLIAVGVDYDDGLERFEGKAEIYEKFLKKFFDAPLMDTLENQIADKDISSAFCTAHNLKGLSGNLGLKPFYKKISELTELLRNGKSDFDYSDALANAKVLYEAVASAIREELV